MYKGYKIRLFPTKEQEEKLWKHIHTCRFIWNYMLSLQINAYKSGEKYINKINMKKMLPIIKKEDGHKWLTEVSNKSLELICNDLDTCFMGLFKHTKRWPKFKSKKKCKLSYPVRTDNSLHFKNDMVLIEKVGYIKINSLFPDGKKYNARVSFVNGKWILSFCVECEKQVPTDLTDKSIGIDLGIKELATISFGDEKIVFHNINKSKRVRSLEHKLKHIDRVMSRKYRANYKKNGTYEKSKNVLKYEKIFKEINYKLSNIRTDYIHKTTTYIVSLLPKRVVMEKLNLINMEKNRHLAKSLRDLCLSKFIKQMQYKCEWNGIEFIQADRWYPSSKTCSCCGRIKKDLKLSDRVYKCECGLEIDRDYNAAINLMRYVSH